MLHINSHLESGKTYKSHREMFPKLFYRDFSGKVRQIKHIDVELSGGDVYVQTDLTDCGQIQRETERILHTLLAGAKKKAAEAQETINTIQEVMPETARRDEALDILDYLLSHNKNYTKAQYYKLLDLQELLEKRYHNE